MPYRSRKRRSLRRRPMSLRGRRKRFRSRLSRRRRYRGLQRKFFTKRQLVPPSMFVKITAAVPFAMHTTESNAPYLYMSFRVNDLDNTTATPAGTSVINLAPLNLLKGLGASFSVGPSGAILNIVSYTDVPQVLSNNYWHLGNVYSRYRVYSGDVTLSCYQKSESPAFSELNMWATDDAHVNNFTDIDGAQKWYRPYIYTHRHSQTQTISNKYTSPSKCHMHWNTRSLISDKSTNVLEEYTGAINRNAAGTMPQYIKPNNGVYLGVLFHPYGADPLTLLTDPDNTYPLNSTIIQGYLTMTFMVKYYTPHDNSDYYGPI
uniref:Putative capsid protein n=1 Tax=Red panda feces-associated circular DNA virus 3 TaxID=2863978 RepID=A0A8K1M4T3_9VIRU|nr:putative capsid protein [Red panda feces-associated circular DNA virus 3]